MSQKGETLPTVALPVYDEFKTRRRELSPQKREIIECLESNESMLRPYEIAKMTGINRDSVSARLSELRTLGLVIWRKGGYYELNPLENPTRNQGRGDFSGVCGWRVQNVNLVCLVPLCGSDRVEFGFGGLSLSVGFGAQRGKISVVGGCPGGLTFEGWLLVLDKVDSVCAERGYVGLDWVVTMCEFLRDHESRRLDGVSGYTLTRFNGLLEKIYERGDGSVRHERRINGPIPIDAVTAFLSGGLPESDVVGRLGAVERELRGLKEAAKYHNRGLADLRFELREGRL